MTNDIAKKQPLELDSIDSFDDTEVSGDDGSGRSGGGFLPEGMVIKFTNARAVGEQEHRRGHHR